MGVKFLRSSPIQPQSGTQSGSSVGLCLRRRPILPPLLLGHLSLDTPSSGGASPSIRTLVCHCEAISFSILSPAIRLIPPCFSIHERGDIPLRSASSIEGRFPPIVFTLGAFDASTPLQPASPSKIGGSPPPDRLCSAHQLPSRSAIATAYRGGKCRRKGTIIHIRDRKSTFCHV